MATVAEIIHAHHAEIMSHWLDEARAAGSARGLSEVALENIMPVYLSTLADTLGGNPDAGARRYRNVQSHLSTRLRQGFNLAEISHEFVLLGHCIAKMWWTQPPSEWPSPQDLDQLHRQIHMAVVEVSDTFNRHMLEDEQAEKRYLRQLQSIATESLHDRERPLADRVAEILEVVMEAMGAKCAAYLIRNMAPPRLELVACAGSVILEPYAASLELSSFAGEVAAHEEPTAILDAMSTALDVPAQLREAGVHSLLGVRLPPRHDLLGVMYIGIAEEREFTPREVRRIEALGERLSLHLENARLFAQLHEKIGVLDLERSLREHFVSTLAHDLRGPLHSARLAAEILSGDTARVRDPRDLAIRIERNIDRVDRMIRDLLDANRIRAGEPLPLSLEAFDLSTLATEVVEEAREVHGDRFVLDPVEAVPGIWSQDELHRSLWNLITNAVKYGDPARPITLAVAHDDEHAWISVHNSGSPIATEDQAHIFDAYARTAAARASGRTGWGLGLTLVRGAAEAHGGRVSVVSDPTTGTTFTIELPIDARAARDRRDQTNALTVH